MKRGKVFTAECNGQLESFKDNHVWAFIYNGRCAIVFIRKYLTGDVDADVDVDVIRTFQVYKTLLYVLLYIVKCTVTGDFGIVVMLDFLKDAMTMS